VTGKGEWSVEKPSPWGDGEGYLTQLGPRKPEVDRSSSVDVS
jgi:hypothetical protein